MPDAKYLIVGAGNGRRCRCPRNPRARSRWLDHRGRPRERPAVQAADALEGPLDRRAAREGLVQYGEEGRRYPPASGRSPRSTSMPTPPPMTRAIPTSTRSCCSPPAAPRAIPASAMAMSSTTARSRTTAACARWRSSGQRIAVIGGGFIGSEMAASLTTNGKDVTMIFPEETISSRVFPPDWPRT